jgi:hypothetical protein
MKKLIISSVLSVLKWIGTGIAFCFLLYVAGFFLTAGAVTVLAQIRYY